MPRRCSCPLIFMLLVVAALIASKWHAYKEPEWRYAKYWLQRPRPAALTNTPRLLKALPVSAGIEDSFNHDNRYQVADRLVDALEAYYIHEDCYPPYLFGGDRLAGPEHRSIPPSWRLTRMQEIDPLLQGGYLKQYPTALTQNMHTYVWRYFANGEDTYEVRDPVMVDQRGVALWRCMYSTPGDYTQLGLDPAVFTEYFKRYPRWWPAWGRPHNYHPTSFKPTAQARQKALGGSERLFALGGVAKPPTPRFGRVVNYRLFPGNYDERIRKLFNCRKDGANFYDEPEEIRLLTLSFFGYQRGEWFGADDGEAWIWFYGSNLWPVNYPGVGDMPDYSEISADQMEARAQNLLSTEFACYPGPPLGLDLLNAQTGELKPDGVPDGICLLCKLSHGKLVEVVDAGI